MQCFIYKSLFKNELYLYLDKKDDGQTGIRHGIRNYSDTQTR